MNGWIVNVTQDFVTGHDNFKLLACLGAYKIMPLFNVFLCGSVPNLTFNYRSFPIRLLCERAFESLEVSRVLKWIGQRQCFSRCCVSAWRGFVTAIVQGAA